MKRDKTTRLKILKKAIKANNRFLRYEEFYWNDPHIGGSYPKYIDWNDAETYSIELMIEDELLRKEVISGAPHHSCHVEDDAAPCAESFLYITNKGFDFVESSGLWFRAKRLVRLAFELTFGQIAVSVLTAVITVLVLQYFEISTS